MMTQANGLSSGSQQRLAFRAVIYSMLCLYLGLNVGSAGAENFLKPTAEELSMTSLKWYPGAPAVVLFREEITTDELHSVQHYERIKILTEEGKKYANVELGYVSSQGGFNGAGDEKSLGQIAGRTIHADGTIIPFTGKPYLKVLEKTSGYKVQQKVFTLPDVEVGSIIEYRYSTNISDNFVEPPIWMVQDDLYVKEAHFVWYPTSRDIVDEDEQPIHTISWFPILPAGAKIETHDIAGTLTRNASRTYELRVKDIPPRIKEEYMPPIGSFSYRVSFSFSPYRTQDEFWTGKGKQWSKRVNAFAGPNAALREATEKVIAGASTPQEKLHKIYSAVMALENTSYTRERAQREDKAAGMGQTNNAADVLAHGRGTPWQLTELFIGMARAAGLSAYAMWVPDRSQTLFIPMWRDVRQLDDYIAIVSLNGEDIFFDPGSRYCRYGQLAWQHTMVGGMRQTDSGSSLIQTPIEASRVNRLTRVANLTMRTNGDVSGKIDLSFTGSPALRWRQSALRGDEESLRKQLRQYAEEMLPKSLELEVADIKDLTDYEKPLTVSLNATGTLGNSMGKRVALPADVFLANASATFPHESRETAVYFEYPRLVQDAVRINLPHEWTIEAVPASAKYDLPRLGSYGMQVTASANNVTSRRDFIFGDILVLSKDYADLRGFYSHLESKDQEQVILKAASSVTASNAEAATPSAATKK